MTTKRENAGVHAAHKITIRTTRRTELKNATAEIESLVRDSGIESGVCHLYVPHTTAGVLVNEGYDPDVARDMEGAFDRLVPDSPLFKHAEGTPTRTSRRHSSAPPKRYSSKRAASLSAAGR